MPRPCEDRASNRRGMDPRMRMARRAHAADGTMARRGRRQGIGRGAERTDIVRVMPIGRASVSRRCPIGSTRSAVGSRAGRCGACRAMNHEASQARRVCAPNSDGLRGQSSRRRVQPTAIRSASQARERSTTRWCIVAVDSGWPSRPVARSRARRERANFVRLQASIVAALSQAFAWEVSTQGDHARARIPPGVTARPWLARERGSGVPLRPPWRAFVRSWRVLGARSWHGVGLER